VASTVHVEAARIPDRDRLMRTLEEHGLDARAIDEVGIEVPCDDDAADQTSDDVYSYVEGLVIDLGAPFVPIKHDGVIYIRPPLS
jgi:hypothetical protein